MKSGLRKIVLPFMLMASLILSACNPSSVATSNSDNADFSLIGGAGVSNEDPLVSGIPMVALLDPEGNIIQRCTGVLVAPKVVLTGAHCFALGKGMYSTWFQGTILVIFSPNPIRYLDDTSKDPKLSRSLVIYGKTYRRHPNFKAFDESKEMTASDLAIIQLTQEAPAGSAILPLAPVGFEPPEKLIVYGFGLEGKSLRTPEQESATRLKKTSFRFVKNVDEEYKKFKVYQTDEERRKTRKVLETSLGLQNYYFGVQQSEVNSVAQGDSGGPALGMGPDQKLYVLGVTSHGLLDGRDLRVALFPNLSYEPTHEWLVDEIQYAQGRK